MFGEQVGDLLDALHNTFCRLALGKVMGHRIGNAPPAGISTLRMHGLITDDRKGSRTGSNQNQDPVSLRAFMHGITDELALRLGHWIYYFFTADDDANLSGGFL